MKRVLGLALALSLLPVYVRAQEEPFVTSYATMSLQAAEHAALLHSPDVATAQERVRENEAMLAAARSSASPALVANYSQAPQGGPNNNTIMQRLYTLGGQVTLGDYFGLSPIVRQAAATLRSAQNDLIAAQRL
jgi:outer membrane protein TolC